MMSTETPEDLTTDELLDALRSMSRLQGHLMGLPDLLHLVEHGYDQARKQHPDLPAHPTNQQLLEVARIWQAKWMLEEAHRKLGIRAPVVLSPIDGDLAEVTYE